MCSHFISKRYSVIDNNTGNILVSGKIINDKHIRPWQDSNKKEIRITFDDIYFFAIDNLKYTIKETPDVIDIDFDPKMVPSNITVEYWNKAKEVDADIFIENTSTQLDPEVEKLVIALNIIDGIETTGSCSGHNKSELWVELKITTINSLKHLILCIEKQGHLFTLHTSPSVSNAYCNVPLLRLSTNSRGQKAYDAANMLADLL